MNLIYGYYIRIFRGFCKRLSKKWHFDSKFTLSRFYIYYTSCNKEFCFITAGFKFVPTSPFPTALIVLLIDIFSNVNVLNVV